MTTSVDLQVTLSDLAEQFQGPAFDAAPYCPICSGTAKFLHSAYNIHPEKNYSFNFRKCRECGHGWIDPMPSQQLLDYLYGRSSPSVFGGWGEPGLSLPERICADRELNRPPMRYFELGVGRGALYELFVSRGWQCSGVDPGDWAERLPNVYRSFETLPSGTQADLLVALDVLEHVREPVAMLRTLRKIAARNARLYCAMPNRESARARIHREKWRMLRPLGHVNYFSRTSIASALKLSGFRVHNVQASDLTAVHIPRTLAQALAVSIELLGIGDQWIVTAEAC
jgi:hypothetical protein